MAALRASVHLNNIGVYLLERGDCHGAIVTLVDAITIAKSVISEEPSFGCAERNANALTTNQQLQEASKHATRLCGRFPGQAEDHFSIVSHDTCASVVLPQEQAEMFDHYNHSQRFTLIRIDWLDSALTDGDIQPDVEACIMLYNLAVAHIVASFMAARQGTAEYVEKNLNHSRRLFDQVTNIITAVCVPSRRIYNQILVGTLIRASRRVQRVHFPIVSESNSASMRLAAWLENMSQVFGAFASPSIDVALAA